MVVSLLTNGIQDVKALLALFRSAARCRAPGVILIAATLLPGCAGVQVFPTTRHYAISLTPGQLESDGVAFITPSTATGREEEKQSIAFVFADVLKRDRPGMRIVALPDALSAINRANLAEPYKRMYDDYRDTGLFKREMLAEVGRVTQSRFIAQIKLQSFEQGAKERFGAFGLRIVETRYARVRLFFQIWDSRDGTIVWEGMEEILFSHERVDEQPVTFQRAVEHAATNLVGRLP